MFATGGMRSATLARPYSAAPASISHGTPIDGKSVGSRLFTLVALSSPGEDWALSDDRKRLYVSMPLSNQVAVVDATTWKTVANLVVCRTSLMRWPRPVSLMSAPLARAEE